METVPDQSSLIQRSLKGEESAFRELVERYTDFAFAVAFRIVNDEEDARDLVQESFVSVWKQLDGFDTRKKFSNWLYRIVVNRCYDHLRKREKVKWVHPGEGTGILSELISENTPERILDNKELGSILRMLTRKLSPKQKLVFVLSELESHSQEEISEITGISRNAVKSNLNHARRNIGELLKKYLTP